MSGELRAGTLSPVRNAVRLVVTLPPFLVRHAWRSRYVRRSHRRVAALSSPPPRSSPRPGLQGSDDGVGPLLMRVYCVDIVDAVIDPHALLQELRIDPNHFNSDLVARFVRDDRPVRHLEVGDELVVELPGPWNGPCSVEAIGSTGILLATLEGHMEAGHISFSTFGTACPGAYAFEIRSWARAGDRAFAAVHLGVPIAKELQTAMWCAMCDRAVAISGGRRSGPIQVMTEELFRSATPPS